MYMYILQWSVRNIFIYMIERERERESTEATVGQQLCLCFWMCTPFRSELVLMREDQTSLNR